MSRFFSRKIAVIVASATIVALTMVGCSNGYTNQGEANAKPDAVDFRIVVEGDQVNVQDRDGNVVAQDQIANHIKTNEDVSFSVESQGQPSEVNSRWAVEAWGWKLTIRSDNHDINAPCARMKWAPHLNIDLQNTRSGQYLTQLHGWFFYRSGWHFGLWDRANGWCKSTNSDFGSVKQVVAESLQRFMPGIAAGVLAVGAAWVFIYILWPMAISAGAVALAG